MEIGSKTSFIETVSVIIFIPDICGKKSTIPNFKNIVLKMLLVNRI